MIKNILKKSMPIIMTLAMVISLLPALTLKANAVYADGTYDFSGLSTTTDSGGAGYKSLGDLFKIPNTMFLACQSLTATTSGGTNTAIYLAATSTTTAVIEAENDGTCGSFTFKDLGLSAYQNANTFSSCNLVLKDRYGKTLYTKDLGSSSVTIPTDSIVNLSTLYPTFGPWSVAGVSRIEITFTLATNDITYLVFENMAIADVSTKYYNAETPAIPGQPVDASVNVDGIVNLSVTASGGVSLGYQWYSNSTNSNSGGSLISGATSATYSAPTSVLGTIYYYCVVTNTDNGAINTTATATSNTAAVVVNNLVNASAPTISGQPLDTMVKTGQLASVSVTASVGTGSLTYQWYSNTTDSNIGGTIISGATSSIYSVTPSSVGTNYYYCIVKNTDTTAPGTKTAFTTSGAAAELHMQTARIISADSVLQRTAAEQAVNLWETYLKYQILCF